MEQTQVVGGVALFMQMGAAVYALRLNRLFGTDRAGWALFGAFALMLAMHLNEAWELPWTFSSHDLKPQFVYLIISVLLLIGLTHVGVLFRERLLTERVIRQSRDELDERVRERTRELREANLNLQLEAAEKQRAQAEQRSTELRYQELLDSVNCVVFEARAEDLRFTFVSSQSQKLLGYPPEEWINRLTWRDLIHPDQVETLLPAWREGVLGKSSWTVEFRAVAADPREVWLRQMSTVVQTDSHITIRGVLIDITERRSMESQLRQAQKLESIGRLAGGVAHDFNNILTVIQGHACFLLDSGSLAEEVRDSLRQIDLATGRAAQLASQLLTFGRGQPMQARSLDLNEVVDNVVKMLRRILGEDIFLQCQYSASPTPIRADASMIEQVLMNLAVNARDAMPQGGELTIRTAMVRISEDYLADGLLLGAGEYACLTVRDTGCGIAPEILPRIFEPFFTTKDVGKGTGLGLATTYGIVRQHRGWIKVQSTLQQGTTFDVYLPALAQPASPVGTTPAKEVRGGRETILVVEDEGAVRELVCSVLESYGYRTLNAGSAIAALDLWKQHQAVIDLLVTDVVMPDGMNGWQLAEQLRAEKPSLKVVCTSGYSPDSIQPGVADQFVPKPYAVRSMAEAVRRALDQESPPGRSGASGRLDSAASLS